MNTITFISTIHKELGKCNSDELCLILEEVKPEVIFLEALENTYSNYQRHVYNNFGVYHQKLEIAAIQKFNERFPIKYVPVLENGLQNSWETKYDKLNQFIELQGQLNDYNLKVEERGFSFLNSKESSDKNEKTREMERQLLNDNELERSVIEGIDTYENSMMKNIYNYCAKNRFDKGVFMCGVAHRNSIIKKIKSFNAKDIQSINWKVYGN